MDPLAAILVALLGGGAITAYVNFRKAPGERDSLAVSTMRDVVVELRAELERKEEELVALRRETSDLRGQVAKLLTRVAALEGT